MVNVPFAEAEKWSDLEAKAKRYYIKYQLNVLHKKQECFSVKDSNWVMEFHTWLCLTPGILIQIKQRFYYIFDY